LERVVVEAVLAFMTADIFEMDFVRGGCVVLLWFPGRRRLYIREGSRAISGGVDESDVRADGATERRHLGDEMLMMML
jgi:hypothetical protein